MRPWRIRYPWRVPGRSVQLNEKGNQVKITPDKLALQAAFLCGLTFLGVPAQSESVPRPTFIGTIERVGSQGIFRLHETDFQSDGQSRDIYFRLWGIASVYGEMPDSLVAQQYHCAEIGRTFSRLVGDLYIMECRSSVFGDLGAELLRNGYATRHCAETTLSETECD